MKSIANDFEQVSIALEWLHDLGVDEIISEFPINRFETKSNFLLSEPFQQKDEKEDILEKRIQKLFNDDENDVSQFDEAQRGRSWPDYTR